MSADRYLIDPLTTEQLAALRSSVCRDIVDTQQSVAEASKRLARARETSDTTCIEMAEACLREGHARLLGLESVKPLIFGVRSSMEIRLQRSAARLTAVRKVSRR